MINTEPCPHYQFLDNFWTTNQIPEINYRLNLTTNWSGTDNEENFLKNPKPGYSKDSVVYKFNSRGYRTHEFDFSNPKPSIICIGCSFTEGVGVNYDDTWVSQIEKNFPDYTTYNLGVGGTSGDFVARTLNSIGSLLNTKIVFVLWPHVSRYEVYEAGSVINMWPQNTAGYNNHMVNETHLFNLREKNRALVHLLSQVHGYTVVEEYVDSVFHAGRPGSSMDFGRDTHPGPRWHNLIAKKFIERYNDNSKI